MLYLFLKASISGVVIAAASGVARKYPGFGGLIASLPLVSILGILWLWRDTRDPIRIADHAQATFWFVLPSLPMFVLMAWMLRRGLGFRPALLAGCLLTLAFYSATVWALTRLGVRL
jgi:hypothetical protein